MFIIITSKFSYPRWKHVFFLFYSEGKRIAHMKLYVSPAPVTSTETPFENRVGGGGG